MENVCKVAIGDAHEIVREGVISRLSSIDGIEVVAEAEDGYSLIKACRQQQPDIVLLDMSLERPSGEDTLARIRAIDPGIKTIVLTSKTELADIVRIVGFGAIGVMPKSARGEDFVAAVRAVMSGFSYFPTEFLTKLLVGRKNISRTGNPLGLSAREIEVLQACVSGKRNKEIASQLDISVRTVETHRNNIYRKSNERDMYKIASLLGGDHGL